MVENTSAAYLYRVASMLNANNQSLGLLKSYYLMKCNEKSIILKKQFSSKHRCSRCCIEWKKGTAVKVKPIKMSKKQRQRAKFVKKKNKSDNTNILQGNQVELTCTFCKQATTTIYSKPDDMKKKLSREIVSFEVEKSKASNKKFETKNSLQATIKTEINVYSSAKEVFSLNNKNNILASTVKETPKAIKNNKRKKDKFAGLCQQAVLASAKLKQEKHKQNKLSLFLKPST